MIIVIDGYNLLHQVFPRVRGELDKQRKEFIKHLIFYKKTKASSIKEIIVVFDGGEWGRATREVHGGVTIIFSGQKSSADEWIIDYVNRKPGEELLLVTLDRELIELCKGRNIEVMRVFDFYQILEKTLLKSAEYDFLEKKRTSEQVEKYEEGSAVSSVESEALDLLMRQASPEFDKKDNIEDEETKREGESRTLSKKEKRRQRVLKKL